MSNVGFKPDNSEYFSTLILWTFTSFLNVTNREVPSISVPRKLDYCSYTQETMKRERVVCFSIQFIHIRTIINSSLYRISRLGRGVPGGMGGVLFYIEEIKNLAFFQTRKFSKFLKNQWKIYNFFANFKWNFAIFENFIEIFAKIYGKIDKILEICICRGLWGGALCSKWNYF